MRWQHLPRQTVQDRIRLLNKPHARSIWGRSCHGTSTEKQSMLQHARMRAGDNFSLMVRCVASCQGSLVAGHKGNIKCFILPGSPLHRSEGCAQLGVARAYSLSAPWTPGPNLTLRLRVAGCNSQAGSLTLLGRLACAAGWSMGSAAAWRCALVYSNSTHDWTGSPARNRAPAVLLN